MNKSHKDKMQIDGPLAGVILLVVGISVMVGVVYGVMWIYGAVIG